jgi:hypothetical protein
MNKKSKSNLNTSSSQLNTNFAFFYLQNVLKISESSLMRITMKHNWILYLKPETNLIPTIQVFASFGFTEKDVKKMVEVVPSVLAINHNWTLPEKLFTLQVVVTHCTVYCILYINGLRRCILAAGNVESTYYGSDCEIFRSLDPPIR